MESRFELPAELISLEIINNMENAELQESNNVYKRNIFILKAIGGKPATMVDKFMTSLDKTEQPHVASYLRGIDVTSGIASTDCLKQYMHSKTRLRNND